MVFDPAIHHRRSIRVKGYDYGQPGLYFITICTQGRVCLLGQIRNGQVLLNEDGEMVQKTWLELRTHLASIETDEMVVMPNHLHGIIVLLRPIAGDRRALELGPPQTIGKEGRAQRPAPTISLGDVVHRFKSLTTARYRNGVVPRQWPAFPGRLWQRNYYEHIIRDGHELDSVRRYIHDNPVRWEFDRENPDAKSVDNLDPWL